MTAKYIQTALLHQYNKQQYHLLNSYIYNWESDYFHLNKTGYSVEIEIKISRSDFRADFKKEKHKLFNSLGEEIIENRGSYNRHIDLSSMSQWYQNLDSNEKKYLKPFFLPNRFYFCTPKGLLRLDELPEYAGLIEVDEKHPYTAKKIKEAKLLHKSKQDLSDILLEKFYWKYINLIKKS